MAQQFLHPAALIVQARTNFEFTEKRINTNLRPKDFSIVKEEVEKRISHYNCLTNAAMASHNLTDDEDIKSYQDDGRREILLSAIDSGFLQKYKEEIHYEKKYGDLLKFISDTIGTQSDKQKAQEAEERLTSVTRHISNDEKFERFLERIKRIANDATDKPDVKKYLVESAFRKNLTSRHISFLREHEKTDLCIENVAKYLDKMKKNEREVSINSLEMNGTSEKISELYMQNSELHKKLDTLQEEMKRFIMTVSTQSQNNHVELNQVNSKSQPTKKSDKNQSQPRYPRRNWNKTPITCEKCGLWGHKGEDCWGTTKCPTCGKIGHSKFICPQKPKISKNL